MLFYQCRRTGSPPHTRGIYAMTTFEWYSDRLTPAYAGNINEHDGSTVTVEAHPRIRGEYRILDRKHYEAEAHPRIRGEYWYSERDRKHYIGSPPHTRGIFVMVQNRQSARRLTPAYAGNIKYILWIEIQFRAHPRIRGEYIRFLLALVSWAGSPPHTRGILKEELENKVYMRLTPAYAGNIS